MKRGKPQIGVDPLVSLYRNLLAEIVETEKEIMVWERKLELEKELQATLESEDEKDGLDSMKKEIHRMELKLTDLTKHQEQLIRVLQYSSSDFIPSFKGYGSRDSETAEYKIQEGSNIAQNDKGSDRDAIAAELRRTQTQYSRNTQRDECN